MATNLDVRKNASLSCHTCSGSSFTSQMLTAQLHSQHFPITSPLLPNYWLIVQMSCDQRRVTTSGHIWWNRRDTSASTHQSWRSDGAHEQEQQENTEKHLLSTTWNTAKHIESTIKCKTTSEQFATSSTQETPGPSAPSWWSNLDCWLKYQDYQFEKNSQLVKNTN